MRKRLLLLIITIISFICLGGTMVNAAQSISSEEFYLITTSPGVDTSKEMNFNWHAKNTGSYLYLYKALDGKENGKQINPDTEKIWSTKDQDQKNVDTKDPFYTERYVCSLTISDLEPRTKYCYYIANANYMSDVHTFTTAGLTNNWEFMAFVDFQNAKNSNVKKVIDAVSAATNDPALLICSGDLTGCGGVQEEFEWIINGNMDNYIFAAAPGDHEYWANDTGSPYPMFSTPYCYNAIFNNPKNGSSVSLNSNYYFYYNNVLFIALDMCDSNTSKSSKIDAEATWFKDTMKKLKGTYQYCVVFEHKSIYGSTQEDTGVRKYINPIWTPLFDEYKVDLAIGGHDHMYSRTYQVYKGKVTTDKKLGTYYLDMGSSGNKYRVPGTDLASDGLHEKVLNLKDLNYAVGSRIKVTDEKMYVEVINMNGLVVDKFEIEAKNDPLSFDTTGFNKDEFKEEINLSAQSTTLANLSITSSKNLKYVKNITILDKNSKEVLNQDISITGNQEYKINKINGLDYKVNVTLLNGETINIEKEMDLGTIKNLGVKMIDEELYLTFENSVTPISNTLFKLTIDDKEEYLDNNSVKKGNAKIKLDDQYIYGEHKYTLELYVSGVAKQKIELTHTEVEDLKLITNQNLEINTKNPVLVEYEFSDKSLVTIISNNTSIVKIEDGKIVPVKNGSTTVLLSINGGAQYTINVTVNMPKNAGCNSGNVIEMLSTIILTGLGVLTVGALCSFRRKKED